MCSKHDHLSSISSKLVDVYCMVSTDSTLSPTEDTHLSVLPQDKRQCTTRHFIKWCERIAERTKNAPLLSINQDVFQEAVSCFCSQVSNVEDRLLIASAIGSKLGLSKDKVEYYVLRHKPSLHQSPLAFTVGRVTLPRKSKEGLKLFATSSSRYAFTRHSINLLEQISICIAHNEPVLLVGETGCGKTATIQYLASQCGHEFRVINMSQQSDVTDLLGGFKPLDVKQIVAPVREEFENLFCQTFSKKQNVKFLGHIQRVFAERRWDVLLKLMLHCQKSALSRKEKPEGNYIYQHCKSVILRFRLNNKAVFYDAFIGLCVSEANRLGFSLCLYKLEDVQDTNLNAL